MFLISALNIDCGYSLETPLRGSSNKYPQSMFFSRNMKTTRNFHLKVFFFCGNILNIQWNLDNSKSKGPNSLV